MYRVALLVSLLGIGLVACKNKPAEPATGSATGKALDPLTIYTSAKEVHAAGYGFLQATADHPVPGTKYINRVNVQMFAVPNADKTWKVVLAQYSGQ